METNIEDFEKFNGFWRYPDEMNYVPHLVYSQTFDGCDEDDNVNHEVLDEVKDLNGEFVACWQFDTACFGDIQNVGMNNGNYLEVTTVRIYEGEYGYNMLVTSRIVSDFHNGCQVELWEKGITLAGIYDTLEDLVACERNVYAN